MNPLQQPKHSGKNAGHSHHSSRRDVQTAGSTSLACSSTASSARWGGTSTTWLGLKTSTLIASLDNRARLKGLKVRACLGDITRGLDVESTTDIAEAG